MNIPFSFVLRRLGMGLAFAFVFLTISTRVAFAADTTAPTVSAVTPTTATKNVAVTISATYSDAVGVSNCHFYTGLIDQGAMTLASGTATLSYTFASAASYTVSVKCTDAAGNVGTGTSTTVVVSADTTAPTVSAVTPTTATKNVATTISATYSDAIGVSNCHFYTGLIDQGTMTLASGTATLSYTFASAASYTVSVKCTDASGNTGTGASTTIVVSADTTAPTVSAVTPTTATKNVATTISATYSDAIGVSNCHFYTGLIDQGAMTLASGTATLSYTFASAASYTVSVKCTDTSGNVGTGASTTVVVSASSTTDTTAPTVGTPSPTTGTVGSSATLTATYSDAVGVSSCTLHFGSDSIAMTLASGTASYSNTFGAAGTYTVYVTCVDAAGNTGTSTSISFVVSSSSSSADTTAPTVGSVTPTSVTANVVTELSVTYSDDVAVTSCTLFDDGSPYAMTLSDGKATYSATFESTGSHSMYVLCGDAARNTGTGATTTVTVVSSGADTTAPVVSAITPTTATVGTTSAFSASVTEAVGISSCYLYVDGTNKGAMTMTTGKASYSFAPSAAGTFSMYALCTDTSGNVGTGATTAVTVSSASSDTTAPTVGALSPLTAIAGVSTTFSATYSDAVGVVSCTGHANGGTPAMALSSGTASVTGNFETAGSYPAYVTCVDAAGNIGTGATVTIVVSAASTDTTAPTVGSVSPTTATQNTAVTFSVTATDASGIYGCYLMVDGNAQGAMTASSSTYSRSYTPASSGTLSVYAWCGDAVGNIGTGSAVSVTVAAAAVTATDTVAPTVGAITPLTATEDTAVTLYASVADAGGMGTCTLYVNSTNIGSMSISGGYASRSYTFTAAGDAVANAYCVDAAGNATRGASSTITISAAVSSEEEGAVSEADIDTLIKLACGTDADAEDPCHAVYYYDGKRHAFPNEKVYFTWYENFDNVIVVTEDFLSSITLGFNVTYHPGTRMVKFVSVNTVYAVGEAGELRGIASEDVASSIWGSDWNTQIDDISDAFYGNYTFGDDINSTSDFDPDAVESSVTNIIDILQQ